MLRALCVGSRFSAIAESSSAIVPWKPSGNHAPFKPRPGDAVGRRQLDALMFGVGPAAADRAVVADDERAVEVIEAREAVEDERHLRRFVFDDRLSQQRRAGSFASPSGPSRRKSRRGCDVAHDRAHEVEPVDAEVVQDQVADRFEQRAFDPAVVPVHVAVDGVDRAQQAGAHGFADVAEVRRPAGVLIDGQPHAHLIGQIGQALADVEVDARTASG